MGAAFTREGQTLTLRPAAMHAADVTATDLRGGAALAIAALAVPGASRLTGCELIERGYEDFTGKLRRLGGDVRVSAVPPSGPPRAGEKTAEQHEEEDGGDTRATDGDGQG